MPTAGASSVGALDEGWRDLTSARIPLRPASFFLELRAHDQVGRQIFRVFDDRRHDQPRADVRCCEGVKKLLDARPLAIGHTVRSQIPGRQVARRDL